MLRIWSSEMFGDHGGQCFFIVLKPVCFITIKYTCIADPVATVDAHYKYPPPCSTPVGIVPSVLQFSYAHDKKLSRAVYYLGWRTLYVLGLLNGNNSIYCSANYGKVERTPVDSLRCLYIDLTCGIQDKFPDLAGLVSYPNPLPEPVRQLLRTHLIICHSPPHPPPGRLRRRQRRVNLSPKLGERGSGGRGKYRTLR